MWAALSFTLFVSLSFIAEAAPQVNPDSPEWFKMFIGLFGGLALFLYGLNKMSFALREAAGDRLKGIIWRFTRNRFLGLITGATVTAMVQSSTVTTVLLVGFISANLMTLSQGIAVILGADIGTIITAQLIAFNLSEYALLPVAIGYMCTWRKQSSLSVYIGQGLMGIGLLFFGIGLMSSSMAPLKTYEPFINFMAHLDGMLLSLIVGAIVTILVNSSAATLAIIIALATQGLISLEAGVLLTFGSNIGTCLTAGLAAIGKPREAARAAAAHVLFKVLGVIVILPFFTGFVESVLAISPTTGDMALPRQIANAHMLYNLLLACLFLPFTTQFARFLTWLIPDRPLNEELNIKPKFLEDILLETPSLALNAARSELKRIGKRINLMFEDCLDAVMLSDKEKLKQLSTLEQEVDTLYADVVHYLGRLSKKRISEQQSQELLQLMQAVNALENIGDIIETNFAAMARARVRNQVEISEETAKKLTKLHERVQEQLANAIEAITSEDANMAEDVLATKPKMKRFLANLAKHQASRLIANADNRIPTYALEVDLIDKLQRIYYNARMIARMALPVTSPNTGAEAEEASQK